MTKKDKQELVDILRRLNEAKSFIEKDSILICRTNDNTSEAYVNSNGERIGLVRKFVGSELNQLPNAITLLESFISRP